MDQVTALDPAVPRADVEKRFSVERMIDGYLQAYETVAGTAGLVSTAA